MQKTKKCTQSISIDCDVIQLARIKNINISKAAQEGIEQSINLPFSWDELQREKIKLEQKISLVNERLDDIKQNAELEKQLIDKVNETLDLSIELIINRHTDQPPVPEMVWEAQSRLNNMTVEELKMKVNSKLIEKGLNIID